MSIWVLAAFINFFFGAEPTWACKCDFGPVQAMYREPNLAQVVFVAKSVGRGRYRVFKVLQSWTPFKGVIKSPATNRCALDTIPGRTYLVYSLSNIERIEKRGFTICDSYASEINDAEPIVEKLAGRPVNNDLSPNPSWFYCTSNGDCVNEKGVCADAIGVNRKFRERMKLWALKVHPSVNCVSSRDVPTGKVECKNYFCEAQVKPNPLMEKKKLETIHN